MRLLILYATDHGSTTGIAERLAADRKRHGDQVTVARLRETSHLDDYDGVIVGSAIHNGQWLPEATHAVDRLSSQWGDKPLWAFSVGSIGATTSFFGEKRTKAVRSRMGEPKAVATLRHTGHVQDAHRFAGAIAPGDWPGAGRVMFRVMGGHYGDARDWDEVDAWAESIHA
ncbi:flavodoxin domain-containing protein [Gordonia sp. NB41Y]|uniref:flavodoxin domain-containing protein n=1 Tax=Gordonia sp. NB41Y TaxID=875808 RepID=UPI0002BDFBDD|nr:flavodoxin domain-containing protein [Gordonia sp. NB41Y]EMP13819.1 hypothetical protein ISGA_1370 [Gordonia sp. NB41Y]WLP90616.1 flavodoxin domain-containing protein [Gordonia sp. NB41Y]